jgi:ribosome-associated toxin RatA of RatAB toxin-antitoxin module
MTRVEKSVLVPYSAHDMWRLVDDIPCYPQFLPWCSGAEVRSQTPNQGLTPGEVVATLHINYHGLRQQFTTRNSAVPGEWVLMRLVEGPFKHLRGEFRFTALDEQACKIAFSLEWTFESRILEKAVGPVFHHIANTMVEAFVTRAAAVYSSSTP